MAIEIVDGIKDVKIGSAASFRKSINDNFSTIKGQWTGVYVGSSETEALKNLRTGGLWIVTEE